jgi:hypothetical protein
VVAPVLSYAPQLRKLARRVQSLRAEMHTHP